jgi:hypothetical protein
MNVGTPPDDQPGDEATRERFADKAAADKAVDVLLAEFNALRAEIVARTSSQAALVGIGLTAVGVIVGFVVNDGGDKQLLLALPPLAALVNLLWSIENRRVTLAGAYIRRTLWREVCRLTGVASSWEAEVHQRRKGLSAVFSILAEGTLVLVFAGSAVAGIAVASDEVHGELETAEWVLAGAAAVLPIVFGIVNSRGN